MGDPAGFISDKDWDGGTSQPSGFIADKDWEAQHKTEPTASTNPLEDVPAWQGMVSHGLKGFKDIGDFLSPWAHDKTGPDFLDATQNAVAHIINPNIPDNSAQIKYKASAPGLGDLFETAADYGANDPNALKYGGKTWYNRAAELAPNLLFPEAGGESLMAKGVMPTIKGLASNTVWKSLQAGMAGELGTVGEKYGGPVGGMAGDVAGLSLGQLGRSTFNKTLSLIKPNPPYNETNLISQIYGIKEPITDADTIDAFKNYKDQGRIVSPEGIEQNKATPHQDTYGNLQQDKERVGGRISEIIKEKGLASASDMLPETSDLTDGVSDPIAADNIVTHERRKGIALALTKQNLDPEVLANIGDSTPAQKQAKGIANAHYIEEYKKVADLEKAAGGGDLAAQQALKDIQDGMDYVQGDAEDLHHMLQDWGEQRNSNFTSSRDDIAKANTYRQLYFSGRDKLRTALGGEDSEGAQLFDQYHQYKLMEPHLEAAANKEASGAFVAKPKSIYTLGKVAPVLEAGAIGGPMGAKVALAAQIASNSVGDAAKGSAGAYQQLFGVTPSQKLAATPLIDYRASLPALEFFAGVNGTGNDPQNLQGTSAPPKSMQQLFGPYSSFLSQLFNPSGEDSKKKVGNMSLPSYTIPDKIAPFMPQAQAIQKAQETQESGHNPNAVAYRPNSKGEYAQGLMQIEPSTATEIAKDLGVAHYDLKDPQTNKAFGTYYLAKLLHKYNGDMPLALTAYQTGEGTVDDLLKETKGTKLADILPHLGPEGQAYAKKILG